MIRIHTFFHLCTQGWSLYAESLGRDLALNGDPYDEYGLLYSELYATTKVLVDTGVHALGLVDPRLDKI